MKKKILPKSWTSWVFLMHTSSKLIQTLKSTSIIQSICNVIIINHIHLSKSDLEKFLFHKPYPLSVLLFPVYNMY